ncbi:hypothetical protein V495_04165 [Pseudogymnoascus sp. VKM F-4514 (FW-929)]|nr:hypothetical protein V495_04165 [Pseudogymnoascus sp. VKM F-4514 (FW-929)]KFY67086.1 hypothetical protein V497_00578 [Pseudogymnoascus sp. VKM F-4516 (FW-969)]
MVDDIEEQVAEHIREILRLMIDVKGKTLRELNQRVDQTSKFEFQCIDTVHANVIMVQNYYAEIGQGETASLPICVEFKHLRRSSRLPAKKRKYEKTQGTSGLAKKPKLKLRDDKRQTDTLPTDGPLKEPASDRATSETPTEIHSEHLSETSTDTSATSTVGTSEPTTSKSSVECPATYDLPTSAIQVQMEGDKIADNMSPATHLAGFDILNDFFEGPAIGREAVSDAEGTGKWPAFTAEATHRDEDLECAVPPNTLRALDAPQHSPSTGIDTLSSKVSDTLEPDLFIASAATSGSSSPELSEPGSSSTGSTSCTSPETHIHDDFSSGVYTGYVKRLCLDDPTTWLEHVLTALETDDTRRRPNPVPGILDDILTNFTLCATIMTSIAENWVKCNRYIAKPAFDAVQERSQEVTGNRIGLHARRLKACPEDIARLDIRELAEMEMQKLLSEPEELTGEFREESDYETAIKLIKKGNADGERTRLRRLWKETYYWPMIQQGAKMIGPLPNPSGRKADITPQEKAAAKKLTLAMHRGQNRGTIFKWTAYWKLLSQLREKGAATLLLYRTREFKRHFYQHPKEINMLLSWYSVYDFPLRQLGARTLAQEGDDFSGRSDIEEKWIYDRLHAPHNMCWGDHLSMWDPDSMEREKFMANCNIKSTSRKSNINVLSYGLKRQPERNKSNYVSLVPYEGESGKRTLGTRTGSTELLTVAPLVPILPGDFLGIFPGRLRYTDQKPPRSIPGPIPNLWLDYSEVMGKLSKMGVAKADGMTNVCLAWEGVNEVKGEDQNPQYLRILVIATRHIMPFDQLVRPSVV